VTLDEALQREADILGDDIAELNTTPKTILPFSWYSISGFVAGKLEVLEQLILVLNLAEEEEEQKCQKSRKK